MTESSAVSRRTLFTGAGAVSLGATLATVQAGPAAAVVSAGGGAAASTSSSSKGRTRMRPEYHFSVPDNWKNDP